MLHFIYVIYVYTNKGDNKSTRVLFINIKSNI